jgi:3-phenylpropionate/trans-cinnamate dioxygenase ferredoxin subunit
MSTKVTARVCALDELPEGAARSFEVGGRMVCVARCDDGLHAIDDRCTHEDYSLADGELDATACEIECWRHGSLFSLVTGEALTLPATRPVAVHDVEVVDGDVFVTLR